jgi:urease accessory protein
MIAHVTIETALRNGVTWLKKAYYSPPLKVADITEMRNERQLQLMLMSASPGMLDEDRYHIKITLEEHSVLQLTTQAYQHLFSMRKGAAQYMEVQMAKGTSFCYLPHPVVPHQDALFTGASKVFLCDDCTLTWGEVITSGRKLNGEHFLFSGYHSSTEIYLNQKLVIRENLYMKPFESNVLGIGQMEGYSHQGSIICLSPSGPTPDVLAEIQDFLSAQPDILFGITAAPVNGIMLRMLGNKAEQLHHCLKTIHRLTANKTPISA